MMNDAQKKQYEVRFRRFLREIRVVSKIEPKEQYIYRIMNGVPFQDLETALSMVRIDHKADKVTNDNKG